MTQRDDFLKEFKAELDKADTINRILENLQRGRHESNVETSLSQSECSHLLDYINEICARLLKKLDID